MPNERRFTAKGYAEVFFSVKNNMPNGGRVINEIELRVVVFFLLPLDWPCFRVKSDEFFYGKPNHIILYYSRRFAVG